MANTRALGRRGERIACRALKSMGYVVVEKNFTCSEGEIDIVATKDGYLCFIEVKSRSTAEFGLPEESITAWKKRKLYRVATSFLERHHESDTTDLRFDIACVDLRTEKVRVIPNAFDFEADL